MPLRGSALVLALWGAVALAAAAPIAAPDADGKTVALNAPGRVTAVVSSSPETQEATREAGRGLDRYRGRDDFRLVIVVDLRGSLAGIASGYVKGRMREDLDKEAVRLRPFYRANGNGGDPRPDLAAVPDFDGAVSTRLGWADTPGKLRVVVYGKDGKAAARWADLPAADYQALRQAVAKALEAK